jgi:SAM-dependent methyltransferase
MYDQIVNIYDQIFSLNQAFLDFIPAYLDEPGAKVLDLACGPGDYADVLSQAGYQVTGIDSSLEMIRWARSRNQGDFHHLGFTEIDQLDDIFQCAYCIGNSLSYLPNEDLPPFLKDLSQRLQPQGYFVLQVVNWDKFRIKGSIDFPIKTLDDGRTFHRRYQQVDYTTVIFHTEIRRGDDVLASWSDTLTPKYQAATVSTLETAGLKVTGQYGDYHRAPFSPETSPAIILVAQKPA